MDVPTLLSGIGGGITVLKDLGMALLDERDRQKAAAIHIDFTNKLIGLQSELMQALSAVIDQQRLIPVLEQRIRDLETESAEKSRYELAKLGTEGDFFVYRLRSASEANEGIGEVAHFLCQPCFDADKKVVLVGNGDGYWHCPVCKHGFQTEPSTWRSGYTVEPSRRRRLTENF